MIVFCLASTRSGTTAISRCFRENPNFVNLGEVFYDTPESKGDYVKKWEYPAPPSIEKFDEYLNFLQSDPQYVYWLDIKFHDLNRFNPRQFSVNARPTLIEIIAKSGAPTVLIRRANHLRAALSEIQAMTTGVYHVPQTYEIHAPPSDNRRDQIKTVEAIRSAMHRQSEFRVVDEHLRLHPNLFRVDYEALFDCQDSAENRAALGAWIGVDAVSEPDLRKVALDWPDWFDLDLAAKILQGTAYQWWVK